MAKSIARPILILVIATVCFLLPFIDKAFHIDDPLFIWTAKQIQVHPLDPYGAPVDWNITRQQIVDVMNNPPLASYYMAFAATVAGWSELALHAAFLIWAIAAVTGTWFLARRLCHNPLLAALLALATPVFLVSASLVMCDVMMLALWVWAVALWIEGLETKRRCWLALSAVFMAAAALTKYFAISLVPLIFIYSILRERRVGWWIVWLALPVTALLSYDWAMRMQYGREMLAQAVGFSAFYSASAMPLRKTLTALTYTGGCIVTAIFFAPLIWSRKWLALWILIAAVGILALPSFGKTVIFVLKSDGTHWGNVAQIVILATAGASLIAATTVHLWRRRDADAFLIFLWILGTLLFTAFFNWSVNGRSILPMVPAAGILIARRIEERSASVKAAHWLLVPVAIAALLVARSDFLLANASRSAALEILAKYSSRPIWFQGHWGFQYYMQEGKAMPLNLLGMLPAKGDFIVSPIYNTSVTKLYPDDADLVERIRIPVCPWLITQRHTANAGFYSDVLGSLPFALGSFGPEEYDVYSMKRPYSGPMSAFVRNILGNALEKEGRADEALTHFEEAVRLNPNHFEALMNAGNILFMKGQTDEAIAHYRAALRVNPGYWPAHNKLAVALYAKGDYARAWQEIILCKEYGGRPSSLILKALQQKMP